ncbi:glycosyltransferase family 4 protein [Aridibaculum aurantiacum]|uniref:glycosyltransferase family 4 protein n=1 Tax=Aridibaculum aurantiacum TaxID=2810307 RepID=UPI001A95C164|nr:glycosyltransferase family 4 protein [Aridibaculum aurantiacum]
MKIIHVTHCYYPSKGGVQWFYKNVSERLVNDYGDDVTVVTTDSMYGPERSLYKKIEPAEEIINGVKVLRFPYKRWHIPYYRLLIKALSKLSLPVPGILRKRLYGPLSKSMKQYLLTANADVVCAGSSNYYYMQLPIWRQLHFIYFGSIHFSEQHASDVLTKTQRASIQASSLYLANTAYEKQRLIQEGIAAHKIKVIGVGVDDKVFEVDQQQVYDYRAALGIAPGAIVIAYVGRIEKPKNVKLLIDAFLKLEAQGQPVYLLIAGAGSDHAKDLQQFTSTLTPEVQQKIKWKINFDSREKPLLFHALDILVLPSNNESFGIVFLEAWVCKKPVIGANIGAVRDVVSHKVDGLLMEMNDVDSLCQHLSLLVSNEELRATMGERGYEKVMENYTWDIITRKVRDCYKGQYHTSKTTAVNV